MDRKLLLKIISLGGTIVTAVATMMLADDSTKETESKVFNEVMDRVNTMLNETKEVM